MSIFEAGIGPTITPAGLIVLGIIAALSIAFVIIMFTFMARDRRAAALTPPRATTIEDLTGEEEES